MRSLLLARPVSRALIVLLTLGLGLAACTSSLAPPSPALPPNHAALVQVAVSLGTGLFLHEHPALAPTVWRLAHDAAQTTQGALDVTQLGPTLAAAIDRTPTSTPSKALLQVLADVVLQEVQAYVARANLPPTQVQLWASEVFTAMERAALATLGGRVPVVVY